MDYLTIGEGGRSKPIDEQIAGEVSAGDETCISRFIHTKANVYGIPLETFIAQYVE